MNIMDHDDDDLVGVNDDDDDDVSLDSFDNEPFEDMMRRLGTNDPSLTTLRVGLDGHQPPNRDWGSLGRAIGMNTQLIKLTLRPGLLTSEHQLASFFSGLAVNRSIQTLKFDHTQLNEYMVELMAPFLAENHVFDCFEFGGLHALEFTDIKTILLGVTSFLLMFDYLKEFRLSYKGYNGDLDNIIQALTVHTGLRKLVLKSISIGRRRCHSLVKLLNRSTRLKEIVLTDLLRINDYRINDDGINDDGWQDIFTALQSTRCKLEKIELRGVEGRNERTALCLSDALLHHSTTLKGLDLTQQVMVVIPLLQDPNTILEELILVSFNYDALITNEELEALTDALATNNTLKRLWLCGVNGGYAAFTRILCNKSSILSTYQSNHTLNMLNGNMFLPEELTSLLQINKENNKNQAARLKIIKTHFSGNDIKMEPFTKIAVSVRPHAIAWMAKDMHLYEFLRAMPSLLEKGRKD